MPVAAPIVYFFFGVGSGSFGGIPFNDAPFAITIPTKTDRVIQVRDPQGRFSMPQIPFAPCTASIAVHGITSGPFGMQSAVIGPGMSVIYSVDNRTGLYRVSFGLTAAELVFGVASPAIEGYLLVSSIGPIVGAESISARCITSVGDFTLASVSRAAFQATLLPA